MSHLSVYFKPVTGGTFKLTPGMCQFPFNLPSIPSHHNTPATSISGAFSASRRGKRQTSLLQILADNPALNMFGKPALYTNVTAALSSRPRREKEVLVLS